MTMPDMNPVSTLDTDSGSSIRAASSDDAAAIAAIYNHYVLHSSISFEEHAVSDTQMAMRIDDILAAGLPWLLLVTDGEIVGYAYASKWKPRSSYRFSVETSVYIKDGCHGKGSGSRLYQALLEQLRARQLHLAIAGIALPNAASIALHEKMGFEKCAHFSQVGFKFGRWIDVAYWQLPL